MLINIARPRNKGYSSLFILWFANVSTDQSILFLFSLVYIIINYHFENYEDILKKYHLTSALKGNLEFSHAKGVMVQGFT